MRRPIFCILLATLSFAGPRAATAQGVILGIGSGPGQPPIGVAYDPGSFGRRVTLHLVYRTGTFEVCSSVDPENVVLVLTIPAGLTLLSESDGGGVYDAVARTLTWSLGTLNAFVHCFGTVIDVELETAEPAPVLHQTTATISTTTAGDEPSDNSGTIELQTGMQPVEVYLASVSSTCDAVVYLGDFESADDGRDLICTDASSGASGSARVLEALPPSKLGEFVGDSSLVPVPRAAVWGRAKGGSFCEQGGGGCYGVYASASAEITMSVELRNPNPFDVPLEVLSRASAYAACSRNDAGHPGDAGVQDVHYLTDFRAAGDVEPGCDGPSRSAYGDSRLLIDGLTGECNELSTFTGLYPREGNGPFADPDACRLAYHVPRKTVLGSPGVKDIQIALDPTWANGDGSVTYDAGGSPSVHLGYGTFNGVQWTLVGPAGASGSGYLADAAVRSDSTIDVRLSDAAGNLVGSAPSAPAASGLVFTKGTAVETEAIVAEIPGCSYLPPGTDPAEVSCGVPEAGDYGVAVLGLADGPYSVVIETTDFEGDVLDQEILAGTASQGSVDSYAFHLFEDGTIVMIEAIFTDGFESGDVSAWSSAL